MDSGRTVASVVAPWSTMTSRPTLLPHLRPLWRDRRTLQLGLDPARAVVVEFDGPVAAGLLDLLDGARTEAGVVAAAAGLGVPPALARQVISVLRDAGVLIDARALLPHGMAEVARSRLYPEAAALAMRHTQPGRTPASRLRRRQAARVLVAGALTSDLRTEAGTDTPVGTHPVDTALVDALTAAGVGRVSRSRHDRVPEHPCPALIVRLGAERRPTALAAQAYARAVVAYLSITVRDGAVVVGPLVPPAGSPCLSCLDLHRGDRDPGWPALAAQLASVAAPPPTCAATTALAGAAYAASEVLAYLDGDAPQTRGATVEVTGPGRTRSRSWAPHPRCDCRRLRRSSLNG